MEEDTDNKPPNGVLIYHEPTTGRWILSANRFTTKVINDESIATMVQMARRMNDIPDEISDDEIRQRIVGDMDFKIGESATALESANREVNSLEEGAQIVPTLWGWLMGLDEDPPEDALEVSGVDLALDVIERADLTAEQRNRLRNILS